MAKPSLRFYVDGGILQCEEFGTQLSKGASCDRYIASNYVQFSDDFLHLQSSSFLSDELLKYLNQKATKVTLLVNLVPPEKVTKGLQPADDSYVMPADSFSLDFGGRKIAGLNNDGKFNFLCSAKSSDEVFDLFRFFAPGFFPQINFVIGKYLRGLSVWKKARLILGF
jgi:hypothetical protein